MTLLLYSILPSLFDSMLEGKNTDVNAGAFNLRINTSNKEPNNDTQAHSKTNFLNPSSSLDDAFSNNDNNNNNNNNNNSNNGTNTKELPAHNPQPQLPSPYALEYLNMDALL